VPITLTISSVDCLVTNVLTRRGRLNIVAICPLPSSSKYAISIVQFCDEFGGLLDELLALSCQLVICVDFNCPGDGTNGVDARLLNTFSPIQHNLESR